MPERLVYEAINYRYGEHAFFDMFVEDFHADPTLLKAAIRRVKQLEGLI